jgi:hypothetical protein
MWMGRWWWAQVERWGVEVVLHVPGGASSAAPVPWVRPVGPLCREGASETRGEHRSAGLLNKAWGTQGGCLRGQLTAKG